MDEGQSKSVDEALQLLSVTIGMLMEDHAAEAVSDLPVENQRRQSHFAELASAGRQIEALAVAAQALLGRPGP